METPVAPRVKSLEAVAVTTNFLLETLAAEMMNFRLAQADRDKDLEAIPIPTTALQIPPATPTVQPMTARITDHPTPPGKTAMVATLALGASLRTVRWEK